MQRPGSRKRMAACESRPETESEAAESPGRAHRQRPGTKQGSRNLEAAGPERMSRSPAGIRDGSPQRLSTEVSSFPFKDRNSFQRIPPRLHYLQAAAGCQLKNSNSLPHRRQPRKGRYFWARGPWDRLNLVRHGFCQTGLGQACYSFSGASAARFAAAAASRLHGPAPLAMMNTIVPISARFFMN
jgi:hypothetical protein